MKSPVVKRSIVVAGHKTSVSLEEAFWNGMKEISGLRDMTLSELVGEIDGNRQQGNLSSAIRLFVLDYFRTRARLRRAGCKAAGLVAFRLTRIARAASAGPHATARLSPPARRLAGAADGVRSHRADDAHNRTEFRIAGLAKSAPVYKLSRFSPGLLQSPPIPRARDDAERITHKIRITESPAPAVM